MMQLLNVTKTKTRIWIMGLMLAGLSVPVSSQTLPLPETLIPLSSLQGERLLRESQAQDDFIPLMSQFVTQENQAFCGVASAVMVLNALGGTAPFAPQWKRNYFTQNNLFNAQTEAIIPRSQIERQGLTLAQLTAILASHSVNAQLHYGSALSLNAFRSTISRNLKQLGNFVVINYSRRTIGEEGGGHISPLAAYNANADQILILDVSRYKYPSVWVKTKDLWEAIKTVDPVSHKTRGIVLVTVLERH